MSASLIDVWNIETFDENLLANPKANEALVRKYIATDHEIFLEREAATLKAAYRTNPYAERYYCFLEDLGRDMKTRRVRAWHYTRLTDAEVEQLPEIGISLSSLDATRWRLEVQVAAGVISDEIADAFFAASPLQDPEQIGLRSDKFWLTSHPVEIGDSGVTLLLTNWGGEAVYFWLNDAHLKATVAGIRQTARHRSRRSSRCDPSCLFRR